MRREADRLDDKTTGFQELVGADDAAVGGDEHFEHGELRDSLAASQDPCA
jgi:hypothetical protein